MRGLSEINTLSTTEECKFEGENLGDFFYQTSVSLNFTGFAGLHLSCLLNLKWQNALVGIFPGIQKQPIIELDSVDKIDNIKEVVEIE